MSVYDQSRDELKRELEQTRKAVHSISRRKRKPHRTELDRLDEVFDYGASVLERTNPNLVSDNARDQLTTHLTNIAQAAETNPDQAVLGLSSYASALLGWPVPEYPRHLGVP